MVSQKTIKGLDFETIEDYFDYIVTSRINGQKQQAKELYNKLSAKQKIEFLQWLALYMYYDAVDENGEPGNIVTDMLNYLNS